MGGSAKPPKPTDEQRKNEKLSAELMKVQLEQAKKPIVFPEFEKPEPIRPPAPPAMQSASDEADAAQEARRNAGRRTNAGSRTLFAGESTYRSPLGGMKTLLG